MKFSDLPLSSALRDVLAELDLHTLTTIQERSIPPLLDGRDLIGRSQTGSGKTLAFALPILQRIDRTRTAVQALVSCPTRELCTQVARELRKLGRKMPGLQVAILCGGQPAYRQREALAGAQIVVGTPGRLVDHLDRHSLELGALFCLVLDEADRMLDMGFAEQVGAVIERAPPKRQTVFFSATFPEGVAAMAEAHMRDPVVVHVEDDRANAPAIAQYAYAGKAKSRQDALSEVLSSLQPEAAIVFCNLKATVKDISSALLAQGVAAAALHGDLDQPERDRVMARFRNQSVRVLVATDVAARGIDIAGLDVVINLDVPAEPEIYVHRIGRTGRAGKAGVAVTLTGANDARRTRAIEEAIGQKLEPWTPTSKTALPQDAKMETLHLSGGRRDKLRPGDILGALTGEAGGLASVDVGKIEIHDRFAYVAVAKGVAERALKSLAGGKIKGKRFKVVRVV